MSSSVGTAAPVADSPGGARRIVITPPRRFPLPRVRDAFEAREVFLRFAQRDITLRYRQTALGVVWVILQPLLGAGVLAVVFGGVAKLPSGGLPPLLFTFAGMIGWNVVNSVIQRGSLSLVSNAALVSKVFFPRVLVPISTAGSAVCDFGVSFVFLGVLLAVYQVAPGPAILLTPVWLLLLLCLASGVALVTSSLMVSYRDIAYIVPFLLQVLLYASPIAYSIGGVPARYRLLFDLNPMTWLLEAMRWSLLAQPRPTAAHLLLAVAVPLGVLLFGALLFEKRERGFADFI